jgi:hypothetical protein
VADDNQQVRRGKVSNEGLPACQRDVFIGVDGYESGAFDAEFLLTFIGEVEGIGFVGEILLLSSAILARMQPCMGAFRVENFRDSDWIFNG